MTILADIENDITDIENDVSTNTDMSSIPAQLDDLASDLMAAQVSSVLDYTVVYGTNKNDMIDVLAIYPPNLPNPSFPLPPNDAGNNFNFSWLNQFIILGGNGNDTLFGGVSDDIIIGGNGNDTIMGFFGSNILSGGNGNDQLIGIIDAFGTLANPIITTGNLAFSPNLLYGGNGNDSLIGSMGALSSTFLANDTSTVSVGGNTLFGGGGNDQLIGTFSRANLLLYNLDDVKTTFTLVSNNLDGGDGNDYLVGNIDFIFQDNTNASADLTGIYLSNTLQGGSGNDTLIGNISCDQTYTNCSGIANYHYSDDYLNGGTGNDLIIGDCKSVVVHISNNDGRAWTQIETCGSDTVIGGKGNDVLIGDAKAASVTVSATLSSFTFQHGNNLLFGGEGNDTLTGGVADLVTSGNVVDILGHNKFVYDGLINNGKDTITDFHTALDHLVSQNGATFSSSSSDGNNNVIVDVILANGHSGGTITLLGVHDFSNVQIMTAPPLVIV